MCLSIIFAYSMLWLSIFSNPVSSKGFEKVVFCIILEDRGYDVARKEGSGKTMSSNKEISWLEFIIAFFKMKSIFDSWKLLKADRVQSIVLLYS